jgi:hypothetical protein
MSTQAIILLALFFGPLLAMAPFYIRDYRAWQRPNAEAFARWRRWMSFSEPISGRQNHLPRNKESKTRSAVFWMEETRLCRFRLRLGLSTLASTGQITWNEQQILVEGRISPLQILSPLLFVLWFDLFVVAAYLLDETAHNPGTVLKLLASMTVWVGLLLGAIFLLSVWLERRRFRQAYREVKARIWNTA